jgi:hypothetical protein
MPLIRRWNFGKLRKRLTWVFRQKGNEMLRELNSRDSDGITIIASYDDSTGDVVISLDDSRNDSYAEFVAPADKVKDAFEHPYAYLAHMTGRVAVPAEMLGQ